MSIEQHRVLVVPARDRGAADKLTLTLHGPKTADRARLTRVLAHLLADDGEWEDERPNVDFVLTMDVE